MEGDQLLNIESLTGSDFDDTLEGNAGNNVIVGGAGADTVSYAHAAAGVTVSLAMTKAQNTMGAGSDTLSGFENIRARNSTICSPATLRPMCCGGSPATTRSTAGREPIS